MFLLTSRINNLCVQLRFRLSVQFWVPGTSMAGSVSDLGDLMNYSPRGLWFVNHLMFVTNKKEPIEAFDVLLQFNEENLHSDLIKQDVLILTGRNDHMVPFKMHKLQVDALINAKSVTERVFTKEENAQNHCQIGNLGLAMDTMLEWIKENS